MNPPTKGPRPQPRWSFKALAEVCAHVHVSNASHVGDVGRVAIATGRDRRTVWRWQTEGMTTNVADKAAISIGLHPAEIWPDWYAEVAA